MKSIVSLEFTPDSVRAAEIAKPDSANPSLMSYAEVATAPGVVGDSEAFDVAVTAEALKVLWRDGAFTTKVVNIGVSGRRILVRDYEAPFVDLKVIKETLTFEAADQLPSQMENSVLDFYPIEKVERNGKNMARGLLVATPAEPLEGLVTACTLAGLEVAYVDLSPFGLARTARSLIPLDEEYFIVNITAQSSEVVAVRNGAPQMVRVVPNGIVIRDRGKSGKHSGVADQAQALDVNANSASSISPVDSFIGALRSTLNYYEGRGGNVQKMYFCGEGSLSPELQEKLLPIMGLPSRILDVESVIGAPQKMAQSDRDPELEASLVSTIAVGLRGMK